MKILIFMLSYSPRGCATNKALFQSCYLKKKSRVKLEASSLTLELNSESFPESVFSDKLSCCFGKQLFHVH